MLKVLAIRLIRLALYVAFFLALLFVLTGVVWGIFLSLPPPPHCGGGFDCWIEGVAIAIGSLVMNIIISLIATITMYRHLEHRQHKRKGKRKRKPVSEKSV